MSIAAMKGSLPKTDTKSRGIFVAVDGAPLSGKTYLINKIASRLGDDIEVIVFDDDYVEFLTTHVEGDLPSEGCLLYSLAYFHSQCQTITELLKAGKSVIVEKYVLTWLAKAYVGNAFKCQEEPSISGIRKLMNFLKHLPVPDITIYLRPTTETFVNRYIQSSDPQFLTEDDFIWSSQRKFIDAYEAVSGLMECVIPMMHDPMTKETDAFNMITMKASMDIQDRPIKFFNY